MTNSQQNEPIKENTLKFFLENLWGNRTQGIELPPSNIFSAINEDIISYLLNSYPFLQIVSTNALFLDEVVPNFIKAKNGWIIHDYGEAMSASSCNLYSSADYYSLSSFINGLDNSKDGEGGESGEGTATLKPEGNGTLIKQAYDTATEMVELCLQKGWPGIKIIAGSPVMQWATWKTAEDYGMEVLGFTADKQAVNRKNRLKVIPIILSEKKLEV